MIDLLKLEQAAAYLERIGMVPHAEEVRAAASAIDAVNAHRERAERARDRAACYGQACRWLKKRVLWLERAFTKRLADAHGVSVECKLCGIPVQLGPMPLPVCGRCIAERQS